MRYKCENCRRKFQFDDEIEFCPYCGKNLDNPSVGYSGGNSGGLVEAIDSIWGEGARIRQEFSSAVSSSINSINRYARTSVSTLLPKENLSNYQKHYATIKQSNNRKTLIVRIDAFLEAIENVIDSLSDKVPKDVSRKLDGAYQEAEEMVKELYDFLGQRCVRSGKDSVAVEKFSAKVVYTREQLISLYNLVLIAYAKYKKCVEDNNMFAAFASTSNYGTMVDYWRRWWNRYSNDDEDDEEEEKEEEPKFSDVVDHMKQQNAKKYFGMLDEDFVPHVDAFWYGLEMLCEFIDHHIAIDYEIKDAVIDSDERSKLLRTVSSMSFEVSEARLDSLHELNAHFEERCASIKNN